MDGEHWTEIEGPTDPQVFEDMRTASFAVSNAAEFRCIYLAAPPSGTGVLASRRFFPLRKLLRFRA
jgi:hypothetical protein